MVLQLRTQHTAAPQHTRDPGSQWLVARQSSGNGEPAPPLPHSQLPLKKKITAHSPIPLTEITALGTVRPVLGLAAPPRGADYSNLKTKPTECLSQGFKCDRQGYLPARQTALKGLTAGAALLSALTGLSPQGRNVPTWDVRTVFSSSQALPRKVHVHSMSATRERPQTHMGHNWTVGRGCCLESVRTQED